MNIPPAISQNSHKNIVISTGTIIKTFAIVALGLTLFYVRDLVLVVLAAIVLASSIEPITLWFARYRIRRLPAVIATYLVVASVMVGFFVFFLPAVLDETLTYLNNLPPSIRLSDLWSPVQSIGLIPESAVQDLSATSFSIKEVIDGIRSVITGTGEGILKTASVVFGGILSLILIIVISFYLSVQEDGVGNFLRLITPTKTHAYITDLWKRSQAKMGYWMQGQLVLGILVGVLVYLGLSILGVEHALLLATMAAIFEIIPVFGPVLAAIPAILIATVDGGVSFGLLVLGLFIIIQQFENHIFYPLVVQKIVGISPIVVILALVIGAKLAGFLGALLAVPLSAALMEYVGDVSRSKQDSQVV